MSDVDNQPTANDARNQIAERPEGHSRYAVAVNRYLGSFGYFDRPPARRAAAAPVETPEAAVPVHHGGPAER